MNSFRVLPGLLAALGLSILGCATGADEDEDGFIATADGGDDCNDLDAAINPEADEVAGDGIDSNCDGDDNPVVGDDDDATGPGVDPGDFDVTETITGNWDCVGNIPAPTPGVFGAVNGFVEDFAEDEGVPTAFVEIWLNNDPSDGPPDLDYESSNTPPVGTFQIEDGHIQACVPFAYRVYTTRVPQETYQTFQVDLVAAGTPPFEQSFTSVSFATYNLLPLAAGIEPTPGLGIAAGRFRDCNDEPVANAEASVGTLDLDTGEVVRAEGYRMRFFRDEDPSGSQPNTSADGLFGAMNVPPGERQNLMVWGIPQDEAHCMQTTGGDVIWSAENSALCLLGSSAIVVQPDSVNIANVYLRPFPESCTQ